MKAQDLQFTQLLEGSKQFVIPIFQRTYSWDLENCQQLWEDILRVGSDDSLNSHFIGSAVYIPEIDAGAAIPSWLVIDGQQRITTLTLILLALKNRLSKESIDEPVSAEQVEDLYLKNRHGKGDAAYRLQLTRTDKDTLNLLMDGKETGEGSIRIEQNFLFFSEQMSKADLNVVWKGIKKLMIVDVRLQQGLDNPQMIFESMNSTGKALTQADLIRNFILMGLEHDLQTRLYSEYWHPMELEFGSENYAKNFDEFVRFYIVIHTGNVRMKRDAVYDEFKVYSRKFEVEDLLASLKEFATYYCRIALGTEPERDLGVIFHDIRELRADVCYPMLMELYLDFQQEILTRDEFKEILRLVESYVFRRVICEIPTNSMRQTFGTFLKRVKKDRYLESVKASFLSLLSYRHFPNDEEFVRSFKTRNLYKFNRRSYWLRRFENHAKKEYVPVQEYTIEHIMPQNENLNAAWQKSLGENWQEIQQTYLHTLGNLTLTGYNSEYSDRSFQEKRDMKGGFHSCPLTLSKGLGICDDWNETEIKKRAEKLAKRVIDVWSMPSLPSDILAAYQEKPSETTHYTIEDHPHLLGGQTRDLFDAFRTEVLALDQCVTEDFLKLYVAFKAETNFVDVVPQSKRLRLSLNLEFAEIHDPRNLCKDVTKIGNWGNGDVEAYLDNLEDLNYIVGLVRQALEKQLGDETDR